MKTRFPITLLAGLAYVVLVFVVPGFWLLRLVNRLVADWSGMESPSIPVLFAFHVALYCVLAGALVWYAHVHNYLFSEHAEEAPLLRRLLDALSLRGYRWAGVLGILVLIAGFLLNLKYGSPTVETFCLFMPVLLGLVDLSVRAVPIPWEDTLPPPRFGEDSIPADGSGGSKPVKLVWNPFLWDEPDRSPVEEIFHVLESEVKEAASRSRTHELEKYVVEGLCTSILRIAFRLRRISHANQFNTLQEMACVVALVRSVPYALDEETHGVSDYADYPVELVWDERGDCEDHAILASALLYALGHEVGLFHIVLRDCSHLALAYQTTNADGMFSKTAANGMEYFYVETVPTNAGHNVGDIPADFFAELKGSSIILLEEG